MPPCHRGDRFPRLAARLDDPKLLFRRPAPPTRRSSDQFNPLIVIRHRHVLEDIPKPSELCRVSGRNGGQFTYSAHEMGRSPAASALRLNVPVWSSPPRSTAWLANRDSRPLSSLLSAHGRERPLQRREFGPRIGRGAPRNHCHDQPLLQRK
jgi:hypothetical protein